LTRVLLAELHVGHVETAFRRLFDEGMIPATARRLFPTLRTGLKWEDLDLGEGLA
jgi:hypothetical protein